ncbi:proline-rich protein 18-like [Cynoglossus semilaevis]|uniref:proline-rich protein 18-like n=1 Tax=Cynoglossus semilaevis TaxID=244447 RepID=UPI0004979DB9|nr:proline-rich protein 18-like [Cynoglossus semilaevis]XP_024914135.1 proline-rich protein 18-like [Cynoglossus semilaevis]XP_024914136.1 proline-rich protein 18-like [Cynoglossus semilaevis]
MPFAPPVSMTCSVSGLTGKDRTLSCSLAQMRDVREDRGSSVKERLTFNLKQLGKKTPTRSRPSAAKGKSGVRSGPEVKTGTRHDREEAHLTLTLTPEAVLLLQRRDSERRQRSATRKAKSSAAEGSGSSTESRCRKDNGSRRHQLALPGHVTPRPRDQVTGDAVAEQGDIRSILKISLLNEQHKYDDVEYEEEDGGVDERVVLKCTEWLRGLENTPVTVGNNLNKRTRPAKRW